MRTEEKKVMNSMRKIFYVADDGTEFEEKSMCRHYEFAACKREVEACTDIVKCREAHQYPPFDGRGHYGDYDFNWYKPLNKNGLNILAKAYQKPGSFADDMVNKWICVGDNEGSDVVVYRLEDSINYANSLLEKIGEDKTSAAVGCENMVYRNFKDRDVEMKELDQVNEAMQILSGIRDNMLLLESSSVKNIPAGICVVFESAIDKAQMLLQDVALAMEKGMQPNGGRVPFQDDKDQP